MRKRDFWMTACSRMLAVPPSRHVTHLPGALEGKMFDLHVHMGAFGVCIGVVRRVQTRLRGVKWQIRGQGPLIDGLLGALETKKPL